MTAGPMNMEVIGAAESVPEAAGPGQLDGMIYNWPTIASIAWEGFVMSGRGHVVVCVEESEVTFHYWAGAPCPCHAEAVQQYDPESEVVVAVAVGESVDVYRLGALPRPPEVWAVTPGPAYGDSVH